jgi:hypothetical protein
MFIETSFAHSVAFGGGGNASDLAEFSKYNDIAAIADKRLVISEMVVCSVPGVLQS